MAVLSYQPPDAKTNDLMWNARAYHITNDIMGTPGSAANIN